MRKIASINICMQSLCILMTYASARGQSIQLLHGCFFYVCQSSATIKPSVNCLDFSPWIYSDKNGQTWIVANCLARHLHFKVYIVGASRAILLLCSLVSNSVFIEQWSKKINKSAPYFFSMCFTRISFFLLVPFGTKMLKSVNQSY